MHAHHSVKYLVQTFGNIRTKTCTNTRVTHTTLGTLASLVSMINAGKVIANMVSHCSWLALGCCALQPTRTRTEQRVSVAVLLQGASMVWVPERAILRRIVWSAGLSNLAQLHAVWNTEALHPDNATFVSGAILRTAAGVRQQERPHRPNHDAEYHQGHHRSHL